MTEIIHTMHEGFCTTCNETEEWLTERNAIMVKHIAATRFELGDIVRIGGGARRWYVSSIWESGRIALSKLAGKGEKGHIVGSAPGLFFEGAMYGDNRYFDAEEQDGLTKLGSLDPLPYDHPACVKSRAVAGH